MKVLELLTESRGKAITQGQVEELVRSDYSDAYTAAKDGTVIYRGLESHEEFMHYNTRGEGVKARDNAYTHPLVNHILERHPHWKNIPSRSYSLIGSPVTSIAGRYGYLYVVLPKNGTKIAQIEEKDFWRIAQDKMEQFPNAHAFEGLGALGSIFEMVTDKILLAAMQFEAFEDDREQLKRARNKLSEQGDGSAIALATIESYDKLIRDLYQRDLVENESQLFNHAWKLIKDYDETIITRKEFVNVIMNGWKSSFWKIFSDPKVSIKTVSPSYTFDTQQGEIWFEGEALMIALNTFKGMIQ